jgi:hypothetical protein
MPIKLHEKAFPCGQLRIDLVYKDKVVPYYDKPNLITLAARQTVLSMLYMTGRTSDPISTLQVGTGGTIDPQGLFPKPVTKSLTALYNSVYTTAASYTANTSLPTITFIADIPDTALVGSQINEAGLFTVAGNMFNIKTFPSIPKTGDFGIHIEWTIDFS